MATEMENKIDLDGSRILYHPDRLKAWYYGLLVSPISIDMALTQACNYRCVYCYSQNYQQGQKIKHKITWPIAESFLNDASEIGVRSISLISDGESTVNPIYQKFIKYGHKLGIDMAIGTNGSLLDKKSLKNIMPSLTYLRFNISAAHEDRYCYIHGVKKKQYISVIDNIYEAVKIKNKLGLRLDIGLQMVLMPEFKDQIIPLTELAVMSGVDYLVIKHCSDDSSRGLDIDYSKYSEMEALLKKAESMSTLRTRIRVKWNKINNKGAMPFKHCYAPPLQLQISGTGLVAPCGFKFGDKRKQYHIGNFCETSFKEIIFSDRYKQVMDYLASNKFDAQKECANSNCLQYYNNCVLDRIMSGKIDLNDFSQKEVPFGCNFI